MTTVTIEHVTASLRCPVKVVAYDESPQLYRIQVKPLHRRLALHRRGILTEPRHLRAKSEALALGLGVPSVDVSVNGGLWLEIPKPVPSVVYARNLPAPDGRLPLVLGVDVHNAPVMIDLASPATPHLLVAGTTGSGKTVLLKSIVYSLASHLSRQQLGLVVIDTKHSLKCVWGLPQVRRYTTDPFEACDVLDLVLGIARDIYAGVYGDTSAERAIVVVIDEYGDLVLTNRSVENVMVKLAQIGREANIHLVVATQRPSREVVTGLVKNNFPARVALAMPSVYDSRTILDRPGAERLLGRGDGLLLRGGRLTRFQAAYVEDDELHQV